MGQTTSFIRSKDYKMGFEKKLRWYAREICVQVGDNFGYCNVIMSFGGGNLRMFQNKARRCDVTAGHIQHLANFVGGCFSTDLD